MTTDLLLFIEFNPPLLLGFGSPYTYIAATYLCTVCPCHPRTIFAIWHVLLLFSINTPDLLETTCAPLRPQLLFH